MLNVTINAKGRTLNDIQEALEEALSKVRQGFTSGSDENSTGKYDFDVEGDEAVCLVEDEDGAPLYLTPNELDRMRVIYNEGNGTDYTKSKVQNDENCEDELRQTIYDYAMANGFELEEI